MGTISIIGAGNMAAAIGTRAARHGRTVELIARDAAKSEALATRLGDAVTVGAYGTRPAGEIVILAVLYQGAVEAVTDFGAALSGKTVIEITNPFNPEGDGLVTTPGDSMSQRIAAAAPADTHVVKAFNTIFRGVLAAEEPIDAFFAGDDPQAKSRVAEFLSSLDLRPRDVGGLEMTHTLEWAGILMMGLARNGAGFDVALAAEVG
jgi:8-hydroxy-5-deazaflavin:NADPH oxidoreductase